MTNKWTDSGQAFKWPLICEACRHIVSS